MKPTRFYTEVVPDPRLAPVVACYWVFAVGAEDDGSEHAILPDGGINVAFIPAPAGPGPLVSVVGPRITPLVIPVEVGFVYWGLRLWPGTAAGLGLGAAATRGLHHIGDMDCAPIAAWRDVVRTTAGGVSFFYEAAGDSSAVFREMNRALLGTGVTADRLDRKVMSIVFEILASGGRTPIGELANSAGLSMRQLQRRFKAAVGLTPKELSRVRRMRMAAVHAVELGNDWSDLAAGSGYADQAHMIREFRELFGLPPEGFRKATEKIALGEYS